MPSNALIASSASRWQHQLRDVITTHGELLALLDLDPTQVELSTAAGEDFPLKVPRSFVRRMRAGDPRDPLLLQVLCSRRELIDSPGYSRDPVGELGPASAQRGIIHKYHGRVLLIVSAGCAVNCRYCFRRHFPYQAHQNSRREWRQALDYIRSNNSIEEVIFSGGDPLVATDSQLAELVGEIADIDHVRRLRVHSRLPIVIPERVTQPLLAAITHAKLQTVMVVHCNHANELDDAVSLALTSLRQHGITVLNQAVLLAGVNDTVDALANLSEALFATGTLPYYLHLLDRVQGAAHFDVPEQEARRIMAALTARLPGFLVPRLVREVAGADAKQAVPLQVQHSPAADDPAGHPQ